MATSSQVKTGLDNISNTIVAQRALMKSLHDQAAGVGQVLDSIAATYSDVLATINAYPANTTDAFQAVSKAELATMTTEFTALRSQVTTVTSLNF
jgi:hypothetical protein